MPGVPIPTPFDGAATGITLFDPEGRFLSVNDRYAEITGYSRDELLDLDSRRITHPDDLPATLQLKSQLLAREIGAAVVEKRYIRKDGAIRWVRNSATLGPPGPDGRDTFFVITEDIHFCRSVRQLAAACLDEQRAGSAPLGRNLHDGAAQLLSALSMELALIRNPGPSVDTLQFLDDCIDLAAQCTREIRTLMYLLQPEPVQEQGLGPAIRDVAVGFAYRSGIAVETEIGDLPRVPRLTASVLFRIVQEWLFHRRQRSNHPGLVISLHGREGGTQLDLVDPSDSVGGRLPEISRRIEWIGGHTEVDAGPAGARLSIWAPSA